MIPLLVDYASPSAFESQRDRATLGLGLNLRRPLRFVAQVKREARLSFRFALSALGELIWSDDRWLSEDEFMGTLDPVVTVHSDRVFFEALSRDQSAYGALIFDREIFTPEGEVITGTTNVDFTAWLKGALQEMRTSRETWFRAEPAGIEVTTARAGGRFEQKVDLPESWVRGFLETSAAMAFPGTRLAVRPVDLLAALRFLHFSKAKLSPRALRYEFLPGQDAALILEPWEKKIPLLGAHHGAAEPRTIRTWGRRRLRLIEPLLPYADRVDIYLKGRAMPSFYAVRLPGATFVLGLTGYTDQSFTGEGGFSLLSSTEDPVPEAEIGRALEIVRQAETISAKDLAERLGVGLKEASRLAEELCRRGRALMDLESQRVRHRELFETPVDLGVLYPPSPRRIAARIHLSNKAVKLNSVSTRETRKLKRLPSVDGPQTRELIFRDFEVAGSVGPQADVRIVVSESGRLIFGRCGCAFFQENILAKGPCEHLLALLWASEPERKDQATSVAAAAEALPAPPRSGQQDREADEEEGETEDDA